MSENQQHREIVSIRASDVVPRIRTVFDLVCFYCDGLLPSKTEMIEHQRTAHSGEDFYRSRRPKITKGEPLMTREHAVQLMAEALQGLAKAADADRGLKAYQQRAEYLLDINDRLNGRHNAGLSGGTSKRIVL